MQHEFKTTLLQLAGTLPLPELPRLIGDLAEVNAVAVSRFNSLPLVAAPNEQWLTVEQAAARLQLSENYIYRHSKQFGACRIGRALRFSSAGLDAYLKRAR